MIINLPIIDIDDACNAKSTDGDSLFSKFIIFICNLIVIF